MIDSYEYMKELDKPVKKIIQVPDGYKALLIADSVVEQFSDWSDWEEARVIIIPVSPVEVKLRWQVRNPPLRRATKNVANQLAYDQDGD